MEGFGGVGGSEEGFGDEGFAGGFGGGIPAVGVIVSGCEVESSEIGRHVREIGHVDFDDTA